MNEITGLLSDRHILGDVEGLVWQVGREACVGRGGLNAGIDRLRQRLVDLAVLAQLGLGLLGRRDPFGVGEETVEVVEAAVLAIDD